MLTGGQTRPGLALLPLRLFLGASFVYAGFQKLHDPGYLTPGAPSYIGTQLHAFATGTPGGFLLRAFALPFPRVTGLGTALFEIGVGLLALAGLFTRPAAVAGLALNATLFLTASWHTYPYFLGSDIVFTFAWLTLALAGPDGQPAADHLLANHRRVRTGQVSGGDRLAGVAWLTRRQLLGACAGATAGAGALVAAAAVLTRGGSAGAAGRLSTTTSAPTGSGRRSTPARRSSASRAKVPPNAVKLGPSSRLPSGSAALYHDPSDGQPDIVVRHGNGSLSALSAVCTHAGCEVDYTNGVLYCPCHGSEFDATTGAVVRGPAVTPLARKRVLEANGDIYAV